jgi:hypothetical protein
MCAWGVVFGCCMRYTRSMLYGREFWRALWRIGELRGWGKTDILELQPDVWDDWEKMI